MSARPGSGCSCRSCGCRSPTILERTLAAEAAGFDSVWLMDHLAAPAAPEHDTFEGWTLASALAVRTTTIRIGHLVTCDPFRHPAVLAKMAATVDVLSEGRLELGLGWGSVERELETYGIGAGPAASARGADARDDRDPRPDVRGRAVRPRRRPSQLHGAIGRPATGAAAATAAAHRRRGPEAHDADGARPRGLVELPDLRGRPARRAATARRRRRGSRCSTRSGCATDARRPDETVAARASAGSAAGAA